MGRRRRPLAGAVAGLVIVVAAAACGGDDDEAAAPDRPVTTAESATVGTDVLAGTGTVTAIGANTVTATARATATAASSISGGSVAAAPAALILGRDGLGVVAFGEPADGVVASVTAVLGPPDADSGWVDPLSISTCAGSEARAVSWGSLSLYFSDESDVAASTRHLFGYSYGSVADLEAIPEGLATPEGIGLGTTVEFLRAAYPDVVVEAGEEGVFDPSFFVDEQLSGRLTGSADDDLVTVIIGGDPCGVGM